MKSLLCCLVTDLPNILQNLTIIWLADLLFPLRLLCVRSQIKLANSEQVPCSTKSCPCSCPPPWRIRSAIFWLKSLTAFSTNWMTWSDHMFTRWAQCERSSVTAQFKCSVVSQCLWQSKCPFSACRSWWLLSRCSSMKTIMPEWKAERSSLTWQR